MKHTGQLSRREILGAAAAGTASLAFGSRAFAQQSFPVRPVTLMCGFAAGGAADSANRVLAEALSQVWKQRVVVENRPSPGGFQATQAVVTAQPDGHTLLASVTGQYTVNKHTFANPPVDPEKQLIQICMTVESPYVVAMSKAVPATSYAEFVALAKREPGKFNYASPGAGSTGHLCFELFKNRAQIDLTPVHYKGGQNLMQDLLANQVQLGINTASTFEPYFKSGQLKPLFITAHKRQTDLPDIASVVEVGLPDLANLNFWTGLHAPLKTPEPVITRIRQTVREVLNTPEMKAKLASMRLQWVDDTPDSLLARIARESVTIAEAVKLAGVRIE